ncbi:MAG: cupin domain-containing protein [Alphaproteobacteria bacterium]|nr:cupin domain-containing protein [Alphaproteobacteria bacterium]
MNEQEFSAQLGAQGYGEAKSGAYDVGPPGDEHAHDFSVSGMVLAGTFILTTGEGARAMVAGDTWVLAAGTPHREQVVGDEPARIIYGVK